MNLKSLLTSTASVLTISMAGCIPLTVGSTAKPVAPKEITRSTSMYVVPNSFVDSAERRGFPRYGVDAEARFGLDDRSDIGIRIPDFSGFVVNYKRRLNGLSAAPGTAVAMMVGGGVVNWGEHAHFEATLITSAADNDRFTPYGGVRAMQVVPLDKGAVKDTPTLGAFFGTRIGSVTSGISPEIGVFYDHSALNLHKGNILFVPAITVHGDVFRGLLP